METSGKAGIQLERGKGAKMWCWRRITNDNFLPWQDIIPSPMKPALHSHLKEPMVSIQVACWWQTVLAHSLSSEGKKQKISVSREIYTMVCMQSQMKVSLKLSWLKPHSTDTRFCHCTLTSWEALVILFDSLKLIWSSGACWSKAC